LCHCQIRCMYARNLCGQEELTGRRKTDGKGEVIDGDYWMLFAATALHALCGAQLVTLPFHPSSEKSLLLSPLCKAHNA
jgi:hypothetical protein